MDVEPDGSCDIIPGLHSRMNMRLSFLACLSVVSRSMSISPPGPSNTLAFDRPELRQAATTLVAAWVRTSLGAKKLKLKLSNPGRECRDRAVIRRTASYGSSNSWPRKGAIQSVPEACWAGCHPIL